MKNSINLEKSNSGHHTKLVIKAMCLSTFTLSSVAISTMAMADAGMVFNRIASIPTSTNLNSIDKPWETETSAEIIAASKDGKTIVYTDSPLEGVGFIDITDPANPKAAGVITVEGEPTAVAVANDNALVGVNTAESYTKPSGNLIAVSMKNKKVVAQCDLGGQPDAVAVSPDEKFVAVAIENERDEDLNDGVIPQLPAGYLAILSLKKGVPNCKSLKKVDLTGLAEIAPSDPEPEFVDFNKNNEVVVTLQENNHLVVVNAKNGKVVSHFSAGQVNLSNVDLDEEGALTFDGVQNDRKREPDAVQWLDDNRLVAANEGDYEGGSRGFTIYNKKGEVLYESGLSFEYEVAMAGHYPEKRSGNKGVEPEGLEVGTYNGHQYIFVMSERGSIVGVYKDTGKDPELVQLLPSGTGPESAIAIPSRNLLVTANEKDLLEDGGARAHVMVFEFGKQEAVYPYIKSVMQDGKPIGWGALSGLVADEEKPGILYAVNDSFYKNQPTIFTIDANQKPAKIVSALPITRYGFPAQKLDLEGIATDGKGGFWLASEGKTSALVPHALYHVNSKGEIKAKNAEFAFPAELLKHEIRFGSEGVTRIDNTLWVAIQRSWKDDPKNTVKLVAYDTKEKTWGAVRYPTEPAEKGWVGLSEITAYGDYVYILERDNQIGEKAKIKRLYKVAKSELKPAELGGELPLVKKELVLDLIPELQKGNGFVVDKVEGLAIDANGKFYFVTDNDGVDDSSGETYFFTKTGLK
jgi:DNA-binding beta-propeller fold protein YncE